MAILPVPVTATSANGLGMPADMIEILTKQKERQTLLGEISETPRSSSSLHFLVLSPHLAVIAIAVGALDASSITSTIS